MSRTPVIFHIRTTNHKDMKIINSYQFPMYSTGNGSREKLLSPAACISYDTTQTKHWRCLYPGGATAIRELPEVAMPYSDMWQDCRITFPHTRPRYAKSSYRSVDPQTLHGNVRQVDHVPNGPTNSVAMTITVFPVRLCGGKPLVAVTRERRYGPSRLRVSDDDDDDC